MLYKFFQAQVSNPIKNDWASSVKKDLEDLDIEMTFDQVKSMSKDAFKELVKRQVKIKALEFLKNIQSTHSKSSNLSYTEITLQEYLKPENSMTNKEKAFAFAARSHMIDVKRNFKSGKENLNCSLGCHQPEDQSHLLVCPKINSQAEEIIYCDIYGNDPRKVEDITRKLVDKFSKFKTTVHRTSQPSAATADSNIDTNNVNVT